MAATAAGAAAEGASARPTPDEIAQRGQLRGLGEELMRMEAENQRTRRPDGTIPLSFPWLSGRHLKPFVQTAAPDLLRELTPFPFGDANLLEAHGEQLLELLINNAPDAVWMEWLYVSLEVTARADNIDVFHRLFALCKNDPDFWVVESRSALLLGDAARYGSAEVLSALLEVDFLRSSLQEVDRTGRPSALSNAAGKGCRRCVALLIKAGAPVEGTWAMARSALWVAVAEGHDDVVLDLLDAGADVNKIFGDHGNITPLSTAVSRNNESMVGVLVAAGADLGKNRMHTLPVLLAARGGSCGLLELMLAAGADANIVNSRGQTALHIACEWSRESAVELLLRHNANPTLRCDEGLSPYDVVATGIVFRRRRFPCTLKDAQTAAADRIRGMLRRASAWGRRGWLVMMRSRRLVAVPLIDDPSVENSSPAEEVSPGNSDETAETIGGRVCVAVEGLTLADVPPTDTSGGPNDQEQHVVSTKALISGGGQESGKQAGCGGGWECAVEWLMRCPDERGVFREILSFV